MMNEHEISESKYSKFVDNLLKLYKDSGFENNRHPDLWGMNKSENWKSPDENVYLVFYWGGLSEIKTPDGMITFPLGSHYGNAIDVAFYKIFEEYDLEFISETPEITVSRTHEKWTTYRINRNIS